MSLNENLDGVEIGSGSEEESVPVSGLDILNEIGSMGAGNAATALSDLIERKISINVPQIHVVSPVRIPDILKFYDLETVVVIEQLSANLDCDILLVFPVGEARKLVRILTEDMMVEEGPDDYSVIDEVGNIIIGNFLNAISDFTGIPLLPAPPIHIVDLFDAILDVFLARISMEDREAILFDARMKCEDEDIYGAMLMFISKSLQERLIEKGAEWLNF